MEMSVLYYLEGWHEKNHKLEFPKLEDLRIARCPKLKSIPCTPSLRNFAVHYPRRIKLLEISKMPMITSSKLRISLDFNHIEPDAFKPPRNVEFMELRGFENVIPLEEDDKESWQNMALRRLIISTSSCFFSGGRSKLALGFWKYFQSLETLEIDSCDALCSWPEHEFRSLKCLKELRIFGCENFTYSSQVSSSENDADGEDLLPRLEKLHISGCPKLVEIPNRYKSLKSLRLGSCPSLSNEGLNWLKNLHELKELELAHCEGLKSLPDGLEDLNSLMHLSLIGCPGIESIPEGLQQRLLNFRLTL
ncbi:Disease resistance protein (TIR-NBS-LRR class) family [Rhynchospora pubera]|uniref:Disease resistance protein (TIR-NBS-LRR class) family n=1 Tax=Rhynchospora pubera TaxID=906938 RepID=A0AAV8D236_9POAL|nr:Disease resistance protein (TIR-NBS-LRR class) family [Rhynchospora pubera]